MTFESLKSGNDIKLKINYHENLKMEMAIITLREALKEMETGNLFSISFVTADKSRQTGGDIIQLENCRIRTKEEKEDVFKSSVPQKGKKQNHATHSTRNIILANGKIRKVHIRLILQFNGQNLIY